MTTYADTRRALYTEEVNSANTYYSESLDLKGFQVRNTQARESWHADIRSHYNDDNANNQLRDALSQGGRVYVTINTGETVSVHNIGTLYAVTDTTGAPAEPLIARMVGDFTVSHATLADLISKA